MVLTVSARIGIYAVGRCRWIADVGVHIYLMRLQCAVNLECNKQLIEEIISTVAQLIRNPFALFMKIIEVVIPVSFQNALLRIGQYNLPDGGIFNDIIQIPDAVRGS